MEVQDLKDPAIRLIVATFGTQKAGLRNITPHSW